LPPGICHVVDRALAREPAQRHASMSVLIAQLQEALATQDEPLSASLLTSSSHYRGRSSRPRTRLLAAAMLVFAGVALAIWFGLESGHSPSPTAPASSAAARSAEPVTPQLPAAAATDPARPGALPPSALPPGEPARASEPPPPKAPARARSTRAANRARSSAASADTPANSALPRTTEPHLPQGMTDVY
jgi:hypothetical protein